MKRTKIIIWLTLLFAGYSVSAFAGTVGILMGRVVEDGTNNPLPGANIILVGTKMGAAADSKGNFIIYNVPAGFYTVKVTMMGYSNQIIKNVQIIADHKTALNVEMLEVAIEGEEVVVTAERPLIQPDVTSSIHFISKDRINQLPVNSFAEVMELQPGVASGGHVRGGRATEVLYLVDGIPVQEAISGGAAANLPKGALEEITLQTGGFNAEYGNAMSGILNITTPTGGAKHKIWLRAEDDRIGGEESNKWRQYEAFASGPVYRNNVNYFLSSNLTLSDTRWWQDMRPVFGSPIKKGINFVSKLNFAFTPNIRLILQGLYSWSREYQYEYRWRYNLSGLPPIKKHSYRLSGVFTQMLTPKTFYTISLSRFRVQDRLGQGDPENIDPDQIFQYDLPWYYFITAGDMLYWQDSRQTNYYGKFNFTSQVFDVCELKFGAEGQYYDLANEIVKYEPKKTFWGRPIVDEPPYNFSSQYTYHPWQGALFFQTKIDNKIFVTNFGLRYDIFDPRAQRPVIEWIPVTGEDFESQIKDYVSAEPKTQLSPRIGISFPIREDNFFYFSFGHFFQIPLFDYLYTGLSTTHLKKGVKLLYGNPDLKPEHTKAYEFSYQHILSRNVVASVTYFKKEIFGLVDTKTFLASDSKAEDDGFSQFVNLPAANSSGVELTLEKRYSRLFSGKLSYTYMHAKGYSGNAEQGMNYFMWGFDVPNKEYYLSWDQRHTIASELFVGKPGNYGINFIWRWNSPRPYTFYPSRNALVPDLNVKIEPNNARMKNVSLLDLKMHYDFELPHNIGATIYLEYHNLFDRMNVLWIASDGRVGGELGDPSAYAIGRRARLGLKLEFGWRD
ncbi:MAG TPA: TonB-dependent receptor [bacterium]|nr:TonB-dependent receptor [bacterium]